MKKTFTQGYTAISIFLLIAIMLTCTDVKAGNHNAGFRYISDSSVLQLADPTIFYHNGTYYLYGTGGDVDHGFLVYTSSDLKSWQGPVGVSGGYALVEGDTYGTQGFWAPQVFQYKGKFYMAYTANEHIAIAVSDSPLGPFKQKINKPISGDTKQIDPYVFFDDNGKIYLYHVRLAEGNRIFVAELKNDLSDVVPGTVRPCISGTEKWENTADASWPVTEGPTVLKHKGLYYLFYSANDFRNIDYAVGYATSRTPVGPWTKYDQNPILSRQTIDINGTGHGDFLKDKKGNLFYVLHTHLSDKKVSPRLTGLVKASFKSGNSAKNIMVIEQGSFHYLYHKKAVESENQATSINKPEAAIKNPVLNSDFPDPTIITANGKYYAYATQTELNGKTINIQVASSFDLQHWKIEGDALPQKPVWANGTQDFWAPHVLYDKDIKKYVMFYSGESDDTSTGKCLGVAFADQPAGPFIDKGTPLLCGESFVNIDPMAFVDPQTGKKLLYWGSGFQPIKVQEMNKDWNDFKTASIAQPVVWPGKEKEYTHLIEGAWVDYHDGNYYLYYSGDNCCGEKANYAVMVARAASATGPFIRYGEANKTGISTILVKNDKWSAPGHNSIFKDNKGKSWIAYHAIWKGSGDAGINNGRVMCISPVQYKNGWPQVETGEQFHLSFSDPVIVNDVPVFKDIELVSEAGPSLRRSHGTYGSQYGRMLHLKDGSWIIGYTVSRNYGYRRDEPLNASSKGGLELEVARSWDGGKTWKKHATITEPGRDLDNAQLVETKNGEILLSCRSVRWQESYIIRVYKSTDKGTTWSRFSVIDSVQGKPGELGNPDKGIYEPHFNYLDNGDLAVMYANESHVVENPSYSQVISERISKDNGKTWGQELWVVFETGRNQSRPGMPVWTKMKNDEFIVVYEVCGPERCNVYYKTSKDGVTWQEGLGTLIPDQLGGPYIVSLKDGTLLVTSNSANVSYSNDYGKSWHLTEKPWPNNLWASIYQDDQTGQIIFLNSFRRELGGNNIQLRFATLNSE